MKRIVIVTATFLALLLCSCAHIENAPANASEPISSKTNSSLNDNNPHFVSGEYPDEMEFQPGYQYNDCIVVDKVAAVDIATTVFQYLPKTEDMQNYIPQMVWLDIEDDYWVVSFWDRNYDANILGGNYCRIILNRKDGAVISVWANVPLPGSVFVDPS